MGERPILFRPEMVRAILAGTKTQTRRVIKHRHATDVDAWAFDPFDPTTRLWRMGVYGDGGALADMGGIPCPYGAPGDRLWVRETWGYADWTEDGEPWIGYRAGGDNRLVEGASLPPEWSDRVREAWEDGSDLRWRPSIHMPRWASRLTLEVTSVRVERLQAITEEDARAEGVEPLVPTQAYLGIRPRYAEVMVHVSHTEAFAHLWARINGPESWGRNPWVWVVGFRRVE